MRHDLRILKTSHFVFQQQARIVPRTRSVHTWTLARRCHSAIPSCDFFQKHMNHLVHSPTSGDQDMYSVLFGVSLDGSVWCPYPCLRKQWFLISSRKSWRHNLAVPEHVSQKSKTRGRCPESSWKQELALRQLQIQACLYTCLKQIPPGLSLMLTVCGTRSRHEGSIPALYRTLVPCSCMSISDPEFSTLEFTWPKHAKTMHVAMLLSWTWDFAFLWQR